jgi:hypothetical protein
MRPRDLGLLLFVVFVLCMASFDSGRMAGKAECLEQHAHLTGVAHAADPDLWRTRATSEGWRWTRE